jgi:hypothetical protein
MSEFINNTKENNSNILNKTDISSSLNTDANLTNIPNTISPKTTKTNHNVIYKVFPGSYPNNRSRYAGKEYIRLLKDQSFMDNFDDADFYMNALFKNIINDLIDEKSNNKKTPRSILPYFKKVIKFDPFVYKKNVDKNESININTNLPISEGYPSIGGKLSKKHRFSKRNKKQKRRTYKKKK